MRVTFVCGLATVAMLSVGNQAGAAINGGLVLSDTREQTDFDGNLRYHSPLEITKSPFDFTENQDYLLLADIDSLSITLTVKDGDTATGLLDHNNWKLGLDDIDTGLKLNGFPDGWFAKKIVFEQIPVPKQAEILAKLQEDGQLVATIIKTDYDNNKMALCYDPKFDSTLELSGSPIPEPSTLVIWSLLGASVAGLAWWRRRKAA